MKNADGDFIFAHPCSVREFRLFRVYSFFEVFEPVQVTNAVELGTEKHENL